MILGCGLWLALGFRVKVMIIVRIMVREGPLFYVGRAWGYS